MFVAAWLVWANVEPRHILRDLPGFIPPLEPLFELRQGWPFAFRIGEDSNHYFPLAAVGDGCVALLMLAFVARLWEYLIGKCEQADVTPAREAPVRVE